MKIAPRPSTWASYWPVAAVFVLCLFGWMIQLQHRHAARAAALESLLATYTYSTEEQANVAFIGGDFRHAAALLAPAGANPAASPSIHLLHARTLECLGRFSEAAKEYSSLEGVPSMRLAMFRGRKFAERMASERNSVNSVTREQLYRLHMELMERGDLATAISIAGRLLPDTEPLRSSTGALLQRLDAEAQVRVSAEPGRLDVTIRHLDPKVLALLHGVKIGALNVSRSGLDAPRILAALDVQALDLSYNGFSELNGVRPLPLRRLLLNDTRTADLRPLAGMPLRELDLSRTMVKTLGPLSACPLEKLNLSSTAIRDLEPLRGLELHELDLSHTRVNDLSALSGMPLERLILADTAIYNLKPLLGARLKSLSLAGTAVKDLAALEKMPLVELDLRGCELLGDLDALGSCAQLERVFLPRHVKVPADHWGLPRVTIVQMEPQITVALQ